VQQKNILYQSHGKQNASILIETQRQLAEAERNAANALASSIAQNPPKALMAVIAPNAVGGWMGPKERDPTDGGGAPCPAEFVKKQEERSSESNNSGISWQRSSHKNTRECNTNCEDSERNESRFEHASREHPDAEK